MALNQVQYTHIVRYIHQWGDGGKQVFKLPTLPETGTPTLRPINKLIMWLQDPMIIPAGAFGDVAIAIDPGSRFSRDAGYPPGESTSGYFLKTLGAMELKPGYPRSVTTTFDPPIHYSNDDCIIVAPEGGLMEGGGFPVMLCLGFCWIVDNDNSGIIIPDGQRIYTVGINSSTGFGPIAIRNVAHAPGAGTKIRVRVKSGAGPLGEGMAAQHVSIGIRDGNTSTMLQQTELPFFSRSGFNIVQQQYLWSDWVPFNKGADDELLVHFDMFGAVNYWGYKPVAADGNYSNNVPGWNSPVMAPNTAQASRTHILDAIEIM